MSRARAQWEARALDVGADTRSDIESLFAHQLEAWALLRAGVGNLKHVRSKSIPVQGYRLLARHIPHRMRSTTARVDAASIRERPCFLCPGNLPPEERMVPFGGGFAITANPYPILDRHVSIVALEHRPQRLWNRPEDFGAMLELAARLPGFLVLYNGPECGASAPDHFHFQACRLAGVPVVTAALEGRLGPDYPAPHARLGGRDPEELAGRFDRLMTALRGVVGGAEEPMVNVVAFCDAGVWRVLVFPRLRHRPQVFHSGELTWTPGALDLTGILVLPVEADLDRIDSRVVQGVFGEVCLPPSKLAGLEMEPE